jgi:hypothetical protein
LPLVTGRNTGPFLAVGPIHRVSPVITVKKRAPDRRARPIKQKSGRMGFTRAAIELNSIEKGKGRCTVGAFVAVS